MGCFVKLLLLKRFNLSTHEILQNQDSTKLNAIENKEIHSFCSLPFNIQQGLYPESHGIIDNNMYDVDMKSRFQLGKPAASDPRWWKGDPVRYYTVWGFEKGLAMCGFFHYC